MLTMLRTRDLVPGDLVQRPSGITQLVVSVEHIPDRNISRIGLFCHAFYSDIFYEHFLWHVRLRSDRST